MIVLDSPAILTSGVWFAKVDALDFGDPLLRRPSRDHVQAQVAWP